MDSIPIDLSFDPLVTSAIVLSLLLLSTVLAAAETALTTMSKARMLTLEREGRRRAALVNRLWKDRDLLITALLVGNNILNIVSSALMTALMIELFGDAGVIYATIGMTIFIVLFIEILPKAVALRWPDDTALVLAPFISVLVLILVPITYICRAIILFILKPFPAPEKDARELAAEQELRGMIDMHARLLDKEKEAAGMLHAIVDLSDMSVVDVMLHRRDMVSLPYATPSDKMVKELLDARHSLVPLWSKTPEDIVGVIDVRKLLAELTRHDGNIGLVDITGIITPPWFIPDTTGLLEQLKAFRRRRLGLAFVVDEYGMLQGIITLADILEEIVGHYDRGQYNALNVPRPEPDGSVILDGRFPIREFNREMGWELPDDHATTMAGLVIHVAEHIPEPGERFNAGPYFFEVLQRRKNRVAKVRVGKRREYLMERMEARG
jgi:Mg2+/Co2+ transporter CorB